MRAAIDPLRGSYSLEVDGPPSLIVEVLSEASYKSDLNLERGKAYSYRGAGERERPRRLLAERDLAFCQARGTASLPTSHRLHFMAARWLA